MLIMQLMMLTGRAFDKMDLALVANDLIDWCGQWFW
jgi:hypothetical protein